ncbi:MAG: hypothetical protein ABJQ64_12565, partial [Nonlabens ulvanivorans]
GCKRIAVNTHQSFMVLMNVGESCDVFCNGVNHKLEPAQTILIPAAVPYILVKSSNEAKLLSVHL